ncbi:MAG: pantoate--beta-alanine ligase [Chloroflexi bacterium]|nr:pantoate--beta-alanine ligase [Chloroflexota bacterium]
MEILATPTEARAWRHAVRGDVGFVPTMGYLHQGHLALVRRALSENAATAVSIFVNPAQFGPGEDFERYPRDEERDLRLLRECGVDAVYLPTPAVIYPPGYQTYVTVEQVTRMLEGAARPGHFRGVATVVLKLLNTIEPQRAYFGRKDAQQLRVIRRMARDLDLACEIVPCDIVREPDGLAMSSRNVYLTPPEREAAPVIHRALRAAMDQFSAGERDASTLKRAVETIIAGQHLGETEYISLADDDTLEELDGLVQREAVLSIVVRFGATRLLDNIELTPEPARFGQVAD